MVYNADCYVYHYALLNILVFHTYGVQCRLLNYHYALLNILVFHTNI
jgi:hypothetical protein